MKKINYYSRVILFIHVYICTYIEYTRTNINSFADVIIDVTKPKIGLVTK